MSGPLLPASAIRMRMPFASINLKVTPSTGDFQEFQRVQQDLLDTMKQIDPLLAKAEGFVNKFEGYKDRARKMKENMKKK